MKLFLAIEFTAFDKNSTWLFNSNRSSNDSNSWFWGKSSCDKILYSVRWSSISNQYEVTYFHDFLFYFSKGTLQLLICMEACETSMEKFYRKMHELQLVQCIDRLLKRMIKDVSRFSSIIFNCVFCSTDCWCAKFSQNAKYTSSWC